MILKELYIYMSTNMSLEQSILSGDYIASTTDKSLIEEAKTRAKQILKNYKKETKNDKITK